MDVDFGLDDGHQAGGQDLVGQIELLVDYGLDSPSFASLMKERILVPNTPFSTAPVKTVPRSGIASTATVRLVGQAFVYFQERDHTFDIPQVVGRTPAFDLAVEGVLEQDGPEDTVAVETGAGLIRVRIW